MSELYFNPVGGYGLVLAVAAILLALLALGPERGRASLRRRAVLAAIRALVILLVVMAMLRPTRVVTEVKKQSATLVLLADGSRSMMVADALDGRSRWEALQTLLDDAAPLLAELGKDLKIQIYRFDSEIHPIEFKPGQIELGERANGQETAIGAALEEVLRRQAGEPIIGTILLSDGAQRAYAPRDTPPQTAARRLADLGCPLYTFAFGQSRGPSQARDVAVLDLLAGPTVFVKNQLDVTGSLRVDGYSNKQIAVQLLFETAPGEMEIVAAAELAASADGEQLPIELRYVPQVPGEHKLTVRAARQDGELVTTNNHLSTFVTVLKGGINVLYLEGALRVEQRFLRAALDASPNVKLDYERIDDRQRDRWPLDAGDRFEPGKYDVYILGDLDSTALTGEAWNALADAVDRGAGLIMLGGYHSFGPGGYYNTALADVLPVEMDRLQRQPFDPEIRTDVHLKGPLHMQPAGVLGSQHPIMQLGPEADGAKLWAELPPLDGANKFERLKPGAVVLAQSRDKRNWPLLVVGGWGSGRVLAFAGDTTWRWQLEGHEKEFRRFWRQIVLWLAKKDETSEGRVWIKLDRRRFGPGSRVDFTVGAESASGDPVAGATYQAEVIGPDGERRPVRLVHEGEQVTGAVFETQAAGDYAIAVTASKDGAQLGSARARFLVFEQDLELDNPAADPGLLSSLAQISAEAGGKALAAEELPDLLEQLKEAPPKLEVETQTKHTYWDTWTMLLLFVTLLGTEWFLRKKWGLV